MPSAKGIGGETAKVLGGEMTSAGAIGGETFAKALIKKAMAFISTAGIGAAIGKAMLEGAALEQSIGGVEAIFGDAADTVKKNAQDAFKTAGVSANQYMEGVSSFAASLMASTGGNAQQAADIADKAFRDMSDNANRFGTDMASIQAAYQGFAKQNYTLLDNLKLGYGGTKTEMERLLKDAEAITGVKYDISNLADVYTAIGVIQDKLNVTGTTAKEAASTFSGSLQMMKASVSNFLGALALGEDVTPALTNMLESIGSFAGNALRLLVNVLTSLPQALANVDWLGIAAQMFTNLKAALGANVGILSTDMSTIRAFLASITAGLPDVLAKGGEIISNLFNGLLARLPDIGRAAAEAVGTFARFIQDNLGTIVQAGIELLGKLIAGLIQAIPKLVAAIPSIIKAAVDAFTSHDWGSTGKAIVEGIVRGILNAGHLIGETLRSLAQQAWQGVKTFLGIGSPSKVFADEIGQWIPAGIALGIDEKSYLVDNALNGLATATLAANAQLASYNGATLAATAAGGVNVNVYGTDSMDVSDLAAAVERRIIAAQNNRRLAWV